MGLFKSRQNHCLLQSFFWMCSSVSICTITMRVNMTGYYLDFSACCKCYIYPRYNQCLSIYTSLKIHPRFE